MPQTFDIILDGSQDESVDAVVLPTDGKHCTLMRNCRRDRTGRVVIRPQFTSAALGNAGLLPQLTTYKGRLLGLLGAYYLATLASELTVGGFSTSPATALSAVENVWQNPSGAAARQFDIAYAAGILCIVQTDDSNVCTITQVTTDGTQLFRSQVSPLSSARVLSDGTKFTIVTRGTTGTMAARTINVGGTTITAATTLEATAATGTTHFDACSIPGSTDYLVTYPRPGSTNMRLRRYTAAHATVATIDVAPVTSIGDLAVAAGATGTIAWAIQDGNDIKMRTLDAALTVTAGPTTVQTVAGVRAPGLAFGRSSTFGIATTHVWLTTTTATASSSFVFTTANYAVVPGTDASAPNVWGASKPLVIPTTDAYGAALVVGQVSAGSAFALPFYSACAYEALFPGNVHGLWDYGICAPLNVLSASDTGGRSSAVTDGTYYYALTSYGRGLELGGDVPGALRLVRLSRDAQRQCVEAGGLLHISGGQVGTYDGAVLSTQNFPDVPNAISATQDASGSQTLLAAYQYIALYEFTDGANNTVRSQPSAPLTVTLTGANNRAIVTVSTPRTAKRVGNGITPRVILYRANPADSVFFRVAESGDVSILDTAATTTINDGVSDVTAETREILYTQSQKPLPNAPMGSAKYLAVGRDRMILGGLQDPYQIKLTQAFFPGEPPECAHPALAAFTLRLPQPCTGVAAFGDTYIAFTEDAIFTVPGAGPQRNGTGEFFAPATVYADGGCIDWRSIVSCGAGTFFQLDSDKLYVMRPNGAVEWIGEAVRDTLATYPVIKGACLCSATQQVVFACRDSENGETGVLLIHDTISGGWYVDDIQADSVVEYNGRLAYAPRNQGAWQIENTREGLGGGSALTASLRLGSLRAFGVQGYGDLSLLKLLCTYVGDSTIEAFASYDDGKTWSSLGSFAVTAANTELANRVSGSALSSGDTISLEWRLAQSVVDRAAIRIDMTETADSGAARLHALSVEAQAMVGTARLNAGSKN